MKDGEVALPDVQTAQEAVKVWAAADPQLAMLLDAGVPSAQALTRWGLERLRANRSIDAATAFRAAVALSPGESAAWTNLGVALDRSGAIAESQLCFERSVSLHRQQPDAWLLLGLARKKQGDRSGAEAAYRVALEAEPTSAIVWQCLGLLKEVQRDYPAAIESFEACVRYGQPTAAIFGNLGKINYQVGRIAEAHDAFAAAVRLEPSNSHYVEMLRKARFLRDVVGGQPPSEALAVYRQAGKASDADAEGELVRWLDAASALLGSFGEIEAAVRLIQKRLELQPNSATARYLLSALLCEPGVDRSPAEYIVENFNAFAEGFDAKLVGVLGYDIPEKLCAAVRDATSQGHLYDALDAGCGTGLCGPLLRPLARTLTGVDLSSKMLAQATRRGVYDALFCEDLAEFLRRSEGQFDLIVAGDVLIYFGDLAPLFVLAARALTTGGLFAFSAERFVGDGYRLQPSGRFAHSPNYVRSNWGPAFVEEAFVDTTIRLEAKERVAGQLFVLRRR